MTQERAVPDWHGQATTELSERRKDRHGHLYYNRGGYHRGYESTTDACHSVGSVTKLVMADWYMDSGKDARPESYETGKDVGLRR